MLFQSCRVGIRVFHSTLLKRYQIQQVEDGEEGCVDEKENDCTNNSPKKRWTATNRRRQEKKNSIPSMFSPELKEAVSSDEAARHYFIKKSVFVRRTICPGDFCVRELVKKTLWEM
jgi:hypothetical protein